MGVDEIIAAQVDKRKVAMGKGEGKGFGAFSDEQIATYKECFKLMDIDKDGVINKSDLRASFDNVGTLMNDSELDSMLSEIGGPCNFENMLRCFEGKMSGLCNDEEVTDVVKGQTVVTHTINADNFKHVLMTFGEKMTEEEIDDVFDEFDYDDDGLILTKSVVDMFVAGGMDEKEDDKKKKEDEEKKKKEAEAKAAAEAASTGDGGDGGKKKKKKKKAAK